MIPGCGINGSGAEKLLNICLQIVCHETSSVHLQTHHCLQNFPVQDDGVLVTPVENQVLYLIQLHTNISPDTFFSW